MAHKVENESILVSTHGKLSDPSNPGASVRAAFVSHMGFFWGGCL